MNENDAVSANQGFESETQTFNDNDSLASLVSIEMSAQLLVLLTDVKGRQCLYSIVGFDIMYVCEV